MFAVKAATVSDTKHLINIRQWHSFARSIAVAAHLSDALRLSDSQSVTFWYS